MNSKELIKNILAEQDDISIIKLIVELPPQIVNELCQNDDVVDKVTLAYRAHRELGDRLVLEATKCVREATIEEAKKRQNEQ